MPKCVSDKQLLANRRNARHSTGPRTPQGKARASRNPLKHGLLAKDLLQTADTAEDRAEFDAILDDLLTEFQPRGLVEEALVERVATAYWRLRRAQRFEFGAIRASQPPDSTAERLQNARAAVARAEQQLAGLRRAAELFAKPDDQLTPDEQAEILLAHPFAQGIDELFGVSPLPYLREQLPQCLAQHQQHLDDCRAQLRAAQEQAAQAAPPRPLLASLPGPASVLSLVRYENMLDRQIHRALSELRRRKVPQRGTTRKKSC
jgi:hypothetical protein